MREHWRAKARRAKIQRKTVADLWAITPALKAFHVKTPVVVTLTRVSVGTLDSDNLTSALKSVRDQIAACLYLDDADPLIEWRYAQESGKRGVYVVRLEIEERRDARRMGATE